MGVNRAVALALKERLEVLFPGKWVDGRAAPQGLLTGIAEIDALLPRGIARRHITEWIGSISSGKTSVLRTAIADWCRRGLNVAYIDTEERLLASDWIFVEQGLCGAMPQTSKITKTTGLETGSNHGRFWMIHPGNSTSYNHLWAADELIRSNAFDVIVLDMGSRNRSLTSKIIARFQNSLARSKAALITVLADQPDSDRFGPTCWGQSARLQFCWGDTAHYQAGLNGIAMITPAIRCAVSSEGLSKIAEVPFVAYTPNRLFTHPEIPDRRASKVGSRTS